LPEPLVVALDLSPLIRDRLSPAAIRLLGILGELAAPASGIRLIGIAPAGALPDLPSGVEIVATGRALSGPHGIRYTQLALPRAAERAAASIVLLVGSPPPLRSRLPVVAVDEARLERPTGIWGRLEEAAGTAALQSAPRVGRLAERRWPVGSGSDAWDLGPGTGIRLPGWTAGTTVLAHGVSQAEISLLLSAWTWVAYASDAQLVILTAAHRIRDAIQLESKQLGVAESVVVPTELEPRLVPRLYARARALLLTGGPAGRSPACWAMASRVAVAAVDVPGLGTLLGDAGYLVRPGDARALGAACLSLLVDDRLSADLTNRGDRRIKRQVCETEGPPLADELRRILLASASR
jgi:glycosyltransferase involved in cell wall biosynthesis